MSTAVTTSKRFGMKSLLLKGRYLGGRYLNRCLWNHLTSWINNQSIEKGRSAVAPASHQSQDSASQSQRSDRSRHSLIPARPLEKRCGHSLLRRFFFAAYYVRSTETSLWRFEPNSLAVFVKVPHCLGITTISAIEGTSWL
jgi:hypothetical protein